MNRFFNRVFAAVDGVFARASAVRNEYALIETGFDAVQAEIDAIRPPYLPANIGNALEILRVNSAGTALEFVPQGLIPLVTVTASRNLAATDSGKLMLCSSSSAINITVQPNATVAIPTETAVVLARIGSGALTLVAGAGVTLRAADALLNARALYSQMTLLKIGTDEWLVGGDRA